MEKLTKNIILESNPEQLDLIARGSASCLGCGQPKQKGLVVCWHCFKYTAAKVPFKNYYGDIKQWALIHSYVINND